MAKGTALSSSRLVACMMASSRSWPAAFRWGAKMKPMPPPAMPPNIQKPQKSCAKLGAHAVDERFGVLVGGPGDDGLDRSPEIALGGRADGLNLACLELRGDVVEEADGFQASQPLGLGAEEVFFGHHLQDRAHVLGHAAVDQHQALLEQLAGGWGHVVCAEDRVIGEQAAPGDAHFGVVCAGLHAQDQLHAGPDAARVLPAAAGAAQPFAQDRTGRDDPPFRFGKLAGERLGLAGGAHADGDEGGQQVGGDRQPRAFGDAVDLAYQLDAIARRDHARQQIGQRLARPFHARRHDARGDHRRLEQAQVVPGKVEDLGQGRDLGHGAQVHAHQPQDGLVDHPEKGFHRWLRFGLRVLPMNCRDRWRH